MFIIIWFDKLDLNYRRMFYEWYEMGMSDVWKNYKVIRKYLQICMRVGFVESIDSVLGNSKIDDASID